MKLFGASKNGGAGAVGCSIPVRLRKVMIFADSVVEASIMDHVAVRHNERCSRQALFGCGFAAMVVTCLQLN